MKNSAAYKQLKKTFPYFTYLLYFIHTSNIYNLYLNCAYLEVFLQVNFSYILL